jgi:hypothetical protein
MIKLMRDLLRFGIMIYQYSSLSSINTECHPINFSEVLHQNVDCCMVRRSLPPCTGIRCKRTEDWGPLRSSGVSCRLPTTSEDRVSSEYFGFPCRFSFHRLLHNHHHLSSGAGIIIQTVGNVPSGLSLTPPQEIKRNMTDILYRAYTCVRLTVNCWNYFASALVTNDWRKNWWDEWQKRLEYPKKNFR